MSKTTYKICPKCNVFVRWDPPQVVRFPNAAVYSIACLNGNKLNFCGFETKQEVAGER